MTTGEVLIPEFSVNGKGSGSTIELPSKGGHAEVHARLRWTFPLRFAELISGDGVTVSSPADRSVGYRAVWRQGAEVLEIDLTGKNWVRLEAWDIACNGAFTQPVWLKPAGSATAGPK